MNSITNNGTYEFLTKVGFSLNEAKVYVTLLQNKALNGYEIAYNHYLKLKVNASNCIKCGHCSNRCPFKVDQVSRMTEINKYFNK